MSQFDQQFQTLAQPVLLATHGRDVTFNNIDGTGIFRLTGTDMREGTVTQTATLQIDQDTWTTAHPSYQAVIDGQTWQVDDSQADGITAAGGMWNIKLMIAQAHTRERPGYRRRD